MVCPACLFPIAGLIAVIIGMLYLCQDVWTRGVAAIKKTTGDGKAPADNPVATRADIVYTSPVPIGTEIRPPVGPSKTVTFTDEGKHPDTETSAPIHGDPKRAFMPLPKGGLSCPNRRWYDSIYNGGTYTEIAAPGIEESDMKRLWRKDYRAMGYNGQFAWGDERGPRAAYQAPPWRNSFV